MPRIKDSWRVGFYLEKIRNPRVRTGHFYLLIYPRKIVGLSGHLGGAFVELCAHSGERGPRDACCGPRAWGPLRRCGRIHEVKRKLYGVLTDVLKNLTSLRGINPFVGLLKSSFSLVSFKQSCRWTCNGDTESPRWPL